MCACVSQTPAAYTMISDLFPVSIRGTANSIYSSGVYLGGALASLSLLLNGKWNHHRGVLPIFVSAACRIFRAPFRQCAGVLALCATRRGH